MSTGCLCLSCEAVFSSIQDSQLQVTVFVHYSHFSIPALLSCSFSRQVFKTLNVFRCERARAVERACTLERARVLERVRALERARAPEKDKAVGRARPLERRGASEGWSLRGSSPSYAVLPNQTLLKGETRHLKTPIEQETK